MDLVLFYSVACSILLLFTGYFVPFIRNKTTARGISWTIAVMSTVISIYSTLDQPPLVRMLLITSIQLLSMKGLVMVETYTGKPRLHFLQWLPFAQGWFGMRPVLFEALISRAQSGVWYFILKGCSRILLGLLLLLLSTFISLEFLSNLLLLVGLSFILHFGILNLSTGLWRALGLDVKELFIAPYKARSLKEFWGKRWNMAFSEMTASIVYKPFLPVLGKQKSVAASFLFSGILHEVAISFPVQAGYGLPLLYFALHAFLMFIENKTMVIQKITAHRVWGHVWVMTWLILPLPLLFHKNFIDAVAKPLALSILHLIY
ncbi:MAG: rane protein [Cytophagaceae bacterium]|jgi:alginate O-acetyltransferase complex protein AlgI|nr:rane protein [Cytophagaceae bacterium]